MGLFPLKQLQFISQNVILLFGRIMRGREFGLGKRWLLMADLEQREKRRRDRLNSGEQQKVNLRISTFQVHLGEMTILF